MKTGCLMRSPSSSTPLLFSIFDRYYCKPHKKALFQNHYNIRFSSSPYSSIATSTSSLTPPQHKPQTPLFLRPLIYSATLSDLHSFFNWAKSLISSVGSSFEQIDNGPDPNHLLRELKWFLDDTLEDPSLFPHLGITQNDELLTTNNVLRLRVNLESMYSLWEQRIKERRPFQYIVGCEHWKDLVLSVEEGVLIPRPETEKIVDLVEDVVSKSGFLKHGLWADLGTGSGALAIGIARVLGKYGRVIATDLSPVAVAVARYNVERYGLQASVEVKQGSWFEPLNDVQELAGLVSNPPYIPSEDICSLQAEVCKHEPRLALDGGVEGLDHLMYLLKRAATMLKPGGFFALETNGEKQCQILADYLKNGIAGSFRDVSMVPDFAGVLRFVTGYRQ